MPDTLPNGYTAEQILVLVYEDVKAIKKTLNGNGRPGLVEDIATLEERFDGHVKVADKYIEKFDSLNLSQKERKLFQGGIATGLVGFIISVYTAMKEAGVF